MTVLLFLSANALLRHEAVARLSVVISTPPSTPKPSPPPHRLLFPSPSIPLNLFRPVSHCLLCITPRSVDLRKPHFGPSFLLLSSHHYNSFHSLCCPPLPLSLLSCLSFKRSQKLDFCSATVLKLSWGHRFSSFLTLLLTPTTFLVKFPCLHKSLDTLIRSPLTYC